MRDLNRSAVDSSILTKGSPEKLTPIREVHNKLASIQQQQSKMSVGGRGSIVLNNLDDTVNITNQLMDDDAIY